MRQPWQDGFPPVVIHQESQVVRGHWCYNLAKHHYDEKRAFLLCDKLHNDDALGRVYDMTFDVEPAPIVVVPARPLGATNNALGRTFAYYVAKELGFELNTGIHQTNAVKRDMIRSPFFRMIQSPTFGGAVIKDANYLLVDDILTLGGTLASLRGFIECNGGRVAGMTALAEKGGGDVHISLASDTLDALRTAHRGTVAALVSQRTGFSLDCLTEPEGRYLVQQASFDTIRAGFDRAANGGA